MIKKENIVYSKKKKKNLKITLTWYSLYLFIFFIFWPLTIKLYYILCKLLTQIWAFWLGSEPFQKECGKKSKYNKIQKLIYIHFDFKKVYIKRTYSSEFCVLKAGVDHIIYIYAIWAINDIMDPTQCVICLWVWNYCKINTIRT